MEPTTALASAIATYILPEAFKEGGKALGKGISQSVSQLLTLIRDKFQEAKKEGTLADFEADQTEENKSEFETALKKLMSKDAEFAQKLEKLVSQGKLSGLARQEIWVGPETEKLDGGDLIQKVTTNKSFSDQKIKLQAKHIKLKNFSQEA